MEYGQQGDGAGVGARDETRLARERSAQAALIACKECGVLLRRGFLTCQLLICCCLFVHDSNVFTSLGDVKVPQICSWEITDFLC